MADIDLTVEICGMSGDGTIAAGALLNAAMARAGLSVMAFDTYPAEIRGFGRCVTRSRIGDEAMTALVDRTRVLISLDDSQSLSRLPYLEENATVFFDNRPPTLVPEGSTMISRAGHGMKLIGIPYGDIATGIGGSTRSRNIVALGAFAALFGIDREPFHKVIASKFLPKGEEVADVNIRSFDGGYDYVLEKHDDGREDIFGGRKGQDDGDRMLLSGSAAVARGAVDAGLKLYFGYPITPATPIMELLAKALPEQGGKVVQMEDEISSIGAVLGAFHAGTRSMTATSGPGFALMTELITHGVMAEIPAVVVNAQRAGPATGLPTKTEQSDLHAAVFGGPGDSARIVLAPTDACECYRFVVKAFQLAEKYQTPVIVLTDFFLNNRVETVTLPPLRKDELADGNIYPDEDDKGNYRRYRLTESGISPRAIPGAEGFTFTASGLEQSEEGKPDYSPDNHQHMSDKRHRKILGALPDLPPPELVGADGDLDVGVIAWGSTYGAALEAVVKMSAAGAAVACLKVTSLYPLHADRIRVFATRCRSILVPELNLEGQLANLLGHLTATEPRRLNRVTGVPFAPGDIASVLKEMLA